MVGTGSSDDVVAVWFGSLAGETWWEQRADEPLYPASLIKLPVATAAQRRHDRGEIDLDATVLVHPDFDSVVPDEHFELVREDDQDDATWDALGEQVSLRTLRERSICVSGNLATDLLLEPVGVEEVAAVLDDAGCSGATAVTHGIGDVAARDRGLLNVMTARDVGRLLTTTPPEVEEVMRGQTYRDGIPAALPGPTTYAGKTGWVDDHSHDAAILRGPGVEPCAMVVLTRVAGSTYDERNGLVRAAAAEAWRRRP
ncbi:MAG: hypothetical protein CMH83_09385 [Nocardioides sp.]|nr:hypothetical protein [Nocardioides sp.]